MFLARDPRLSTNDEQVHKLCQTSAPHILSSFCPNLIIAIGGGGYVPARILRSFLKQTGQANIPIQAIGLSLYETLGTNLKKNASTSTSAVDLKSLSQPAVPEETDIEEVGTQVTRTQWLDLSSLEMENLIGKNVLIVDEVDDTRTTLEYAVRELQKDVELATERAGRKGETTKFSIFVLHNKNKTKKGHLPEEVLSENRYLAAVTVGDEWICYPWEAM